MYKFILAISFILLSFSQLSFAETCPSVNDIKKQTLAPGWKAYDSDDNSVLPPARMMQLASHVDQFALAEWLEGEPGKGSVHCYYRDKHGSNLEAYFSKDNFKLDNRKNVWYQVSGFMHCAAGMEQCTFKSNGIMPEHQLAKK